MRNHMKMLSKIRWEATHLVKACGRKLARRDPLFLIYDF
jgi:hypothetical protein